MQNYCPFVQLFCTEKLNSKKVSKNFICSLNKLTIWLLPELLIDLYIYCRIIFSHFIETG